MKSDWPTVKLGEIVFEERLPVGTFDGNGLPVLGVTNVDGVTHTGITASEDLSKYLRLKPGRFVYNPYRINVGSLGLSSETQDGITSPAYVVFAPGEHVDAKFLHYYLKSARGSQLINFYGNRGTVRSALRFNDLCQIEIPLPPLAEQRRIVARIAELAAQINEALPLRQQAMKETEGITYSLLNQFFLKLQHEMNPTRLDSIANCRLGKMLNPKAKIGVGLTPYLRNANIQWGYLDLRSVYKMDFKDLERKEFELKAGDILVCEGGDIGKAAIWNDEIPGCCYQKALHRIRCDSDRAIPRFLLYHFFWAAHEGHWLGLKTQTTIPHLTGIKLKAYPVYIPSLQEQCRIIAELDALQADVDSLKRLQAETSAELDALLPSILDRAFKGDI